MLNLILTILLIIIAIRIVVIIILFNNIDLNLLLLSCIIIAIRVFGGDVAFAGSDPGSDDDNMDLDSESDSKSDKDRMDLDEPRITEKGLGKRKLIESPDPQEATAKSLEEAKRQEELDMQEAIRKSKLDTHYDVNAPGSSRQGDIQPENLNVPMLSKEPQSNDYKPQISYSDYEFSSDAESDSSYSVSPTPSPVHSEDAIDPDKLKEKLN